MLKLLKYEFKGNFKDIITMLLTIIMLYAICMIVLYNGYKTLSFVVSILIIFSVAISLVIISIQIFAKELKDESKALKFTLPVDPAEIIISKMIFSYLITIICSVLTFLLFICMITNPKMGLGININTLAGLIGIKEVMFLIISGSAECIFFLSLVYFSIVVTRMHIKNNRISMFFAIPVYIVLQNIVSLISFFINKYIPATFNLGFKVLLKIDMKSTGNGISGGIVPKLASVNIIDFIFYVVTFIILMKVMINIMRRKADI